MNPALDSMIIRDATPDDFETIATIYEQNVLLGTGSFEVTPPSTDEMLKRFKDIQKFGGVWLVAVLRNTVIGFAYSGPYRERAAYSNTCSDSIYLPPEIQGNGIGTVLLRELIKRSEEAGFRQMIAIIGDSGNSRSIELHKKLGFDEVGRLKNVGYKFNRWLDSVLMQRKLGCGADLPPKRYR